MCVNAEKQFTKSSKLFFYWWILELEIGKTGYLANISFDEWKLMLNLTSICFGKLKSPKDFYLAFLAAKCTKLGPKF